MNFTHLTFDHVGIRVTALGVSERFYAKFDFIRDPREFAPAVKTCGLHNPSGLRIHLIFNAAPDPVGNVLDLQRFCAGHLSVLSLYQETDDTMKHTVDFKREAVRIALSSGL